MAKIVLNVNNITKTFKERVAVDNVSFSINEGEIYGLIGPNGAGKTTIIRLLTGLAKPDSGTVTINGFDIQKDFKKAIDGVGAIIEEPHFYGNLSGLQNLKFFARLSSGITKEKIDDCVKIVGLENRIKDKVKTYSLGMKQRLGIAQALLNSPNLLILDEPINGLDPFGIAEVRKFLKRLSKEKKIAILISSHILSEMEKTCDTIGILSNGKIIQTKTIKDFGNLINETKRILIKVDYPNFAAKLVNEQFNIEVQLIANNIVFETQERDIPSIIKALISKNISIFESKVENKTLEEIYLTSIDPADKKIN